MGSRESIGRMNQTDSIQISVVILTLDEEHNLPGCLESCIGMDDIHVLDCGSEDKTAEVSKSYGAKVWVHPFESFGAQRNWAIDNIDTKYDWILHLDADEHLTPELLAEMRDLINSKPNEAGFYIPSKVMFMNRWLKHCGGYPNYQMRLFHKNRMRFQDHGHGQRELTDGAIGMIKEPYLHYVFSKGIAHWLAKHNIYATQEARQAIAEDDGLDLKGLFSTDRITRRRSIKRMSFRLPMRDKLRVLQLLILQGGILDGRAGLMYARLMSIYERMIAVKYKLLRYGESEGRKGRSYRSDNI